MAAAAEVQLREALLADVADRVTFGFEARVDHLGKAAHPIDEDCDLHVPLRSETLLIPLLAEVKNACSFPPDATPVSLRKLIVERIGSRQVPVVGVFRIWLEHPPPGSKAQREGDPLPDYPNSNPDHQVELHPLLQLGDLDFRQHIREIRHRSARYGGFGPAELRRVLAKNIKLRRLDVDLVVNGAPKRERYVAISGDKVGFNHWVLRGTVRSDPRKLPDGVEFTVDVEDRGRPIAAAASLPVRAIEKTEPFDAASELKPGDRVAFQALGRLSVRTILEQATPGAGRQIPLPLEFVLLSVKRLSS